MADENDLQGTQPAPEGETVENPGNTAAPEQNDEQQNTEQDAATEGGEQQPAAEAAQEEKPKQKPAFYEKRFGELTFEKREALRKLAEAQAEIAALKAGKTPTETEEPTPTAQPASGLTQADVDRRAAELVRNQAFAGKVDGLIQAGNTKFDKDTFTQKSNLVAGLAGDRTQELMQVLTDPELVKDGHEVIAALADDPEEAERILSLIPVKMALELTKLSEKISKPTPKNLSKVPAPVSPVNGAAQAATRLDDPDLPMDEFGPKFLQQMAKHRR